MTQPSAVLDSPVGWDLTVANARGFIDFAIENRVPREELLEHPFMQAILKKALASTRFFGQVFIDSYYRPMTHQHEQYWDVIEDISIPYAAMICWRGFGKSTGGNTLAIQSICFQLDRFILVVSKTHDEASRITENIKLDLLTNRRLRAVFGSFKKSIRKAKDVEAMEDADFDLMFSRKGWFTCDPQTGAPSCFIMPKGCEQQVRGLSIYVMGLLWRPTLLIIDDLEDRELLTNEKNRDRIKNWLYDDLLPVVPAERPVAIGPMAGRWVLKPGERPPFRVIYLDTYKHTDSIVAELLDSPKWKSRVFPQSELRVDPDGKRRFYSLVPSFISHEQVRAEVRDAMRRGRMDGYCREFMCLPHNPANMSWTKDMFVRFKESDESLTMRADVTKFVVCDPARGTDGDNCPTGALAYGVSASEHYIWVRKEINEKIPVIEIPGRMCDLCVETGSRILFVEVDGPEDWAILDFQDEIARRCLPIHLIPLYARKKTPGVEYGSGVDARKRADAGGALRYYKAKQIAHEESLADGPLEKQCLSWPNPAGWDSLDCLGHFKRACMLINLYFHIKPAAEAGFESDRSMMKKLREASRRKQGNIVYLEPQDYNEVCNVG